MIRSGSFAIIAALLLLASSGASCSAVQELPGAGDPLYCQLEASDEERFLRALNRARYKERKTDGLFGDGDLIRAARSQAQILAHSDELSHESLEGGPSDRLQRRGIVRRYVAENIARLPHGAAPLRRVYEYWMQRPEERASMLHPRYRRAGLAMAPGEDYCFIVLLLTD